GEQHRATLTLPRDRRTSGGRIRRAQRIANVGGGTRRRRYAGDAPCRSCSSPRSTRRATRRPSCATSCARPASRSFSPTAGRSGRRRGGAGEEVFGGGGATLDEVRARGDRGAAVNAAAAGAAAIARRMHDAGELLGVLGIGGSAGTTIGTAAMRALPIGVPKLMVST